jgi:hypothetical protein
MLVRMGRGLLLITTVLVAAGCSSSHPALRDPVPQTSAQTAAVDEATQCLVGKARAYDDGRISDKALAKLIGPLCERSFETQHAAFTNGEPMTSRDVKVVRKVDYREALRAVLFERSERRAAALSRSR